MSSGLDEKNPLSRSHCSQFKADVSAAKTKGAQITSDYLYSRCRYMINTTPSE